ncbi:bifunctional diaminohydroxyphosphoribosylaminopyrimidine deaminase/5-amino-6-(5-phosphoribosylamino)uracil reductase RibD [Alishewanella sp. HL-SH06]|uniref:bifunctional diaminohydroxyphosphoribosylaminopyrimidine deaminase/5-amino-6-(5-phosphoribosylamino)uracil reductase RibD n=1 Tax=Alishewanella sp. HL-SH06 TaxID=3461144 RepID=UPI0040426DFE
MSFSEADHQYMTLALSLAAAGRFTTDPNPNVGAVLVKKAQVIGQGYHRQAGQGHAEVYALQQAGSAAAGATCYVTLEPCAHYGRTPPCAEALVKAGVSRVVIAMLDPNPLVAGKGVAILESAGISVQHGLLTNAARALNPGFLSRMERQRPYVWLKMAASLDGRTALANGVSQWLTGDVARDDVQQFRAQSSAILSTASTVLADNARLTVRQTASNTITTLADGGLRQPLRVILDRQQRLTGTEALFSQGGAVLLCYDAAQAAKQLSASAVAVTQWPAALLPSGQFDLSALLKALHQQQINSVWTEAGSTLAGALLQQGLVDELILYQAPLLLGDCAQPLAKLGDFQQLTEVPHLTLLDVHQLGNDIRIRAKPTTATVANPTKES